MISVREQCKKLYIEAFKDDLEFTELLFDTLFDSSCRYLLEGERVVSMLFAVDVALNGNKGKYVYAVATDEKMRGKGYMRILFDKITDEFIKDYDFLCLRPMNDGLFSFYEKLCFERKFKKSKIIKSVSKNNPELVLVEDINSIKKIRKTLLKENYVEYSDDFYKLILSYCNAYCDDIASPTVFAVSEKISQKVKEVLGNYNNLPENFSNKELLINGDEFDFAMIKPLKNKKFEGYLGYALD